MVDTNGERIRVYSTATGWIDTLAGQALTPPQYVDAVGSAAALDRPRGLTSDGTSVYWGEQNELTVRQAVVDGGSVTTLVGERGGQGPVEGIGGTGAAPGTCAGTPPNGRARLDTPWALVFDYPSNSPFVLEATRIARVR